MNRERLKKILKRWHPDFNGGQQSRLNIVRTAIKRYQKSKNKRCECGDFKHAVSKRCRMCALKFNRKRMALAGMWLLLCPLVLGQSVPIAWDASPSSTNQPIGYRLYASTNAFGETNKLTVPVRLNAGTNLTATITNALPGTWHVRATAYNLSNVLESVLSDPLIFSVPEPPSNLRTVMLQWNATVDGTNWIDTGFFRIKFGP